MESEQKKVDAEIDKLNLGPAVTFTKETGTRVLQ